MDVEVLEQYTGYKVVAGSTLHGMATKTSDTDVKAVVRLPDHLGYTLKKPWETDTYHNPDVEYHSFTKFVRLLSAQSVMAFELLGAPESLVLECGVLGTRLREVGSKFLTKGYKNSACGLADGFLLRVKESVTYHKNAPLDDLQQLTALRVKNSLERVLENAKVRLGLEDLNVTFSTESGLYLPDEALVVDLDESPVDAVLLKALLSEVTSSHSQLMKRKRHYVTTDTEDVRKDVAHALRMKHSAYQALRDGYVNPQVGSLRDDLLRVRRGDYSWDQVFEWDAELTLQVESEYKRTSLPSKLDDTFVSTFVQSVMEETRC